MNRITIEEEYKKNKDDLRKEDVEALQEWMRSKPHLPKVEDRQVVLFLHSNYYDIEKAKVTIENYYTMRTQYTDFFTDRDIYSKALREAREVMNVGFLPQKTKEGYDVLFMRLHNTDASLSTFVDNMKLYLMVVDIWLLEHGTHKGFVAVFDMEGSTWSHIMKMSLRAARQHLTYNQEAMPVRLKALVHINVPSFMGRIMAMMRPFIHDEVYKMIRFGSKPEDVFDLIPAEVFPRDIPGGKGPSYEELYTEFNRKLEQYQDFFLNEDLNYRVDESKRVQIPKKRFWNVFG